MYLGHVVRNGTISSQESKLLAIKTFARSGTKKLGYSLLSLAITEDSLRGIHPLLHHLQTSPRSRVLTWSSGQECESAFLAFKGKTILLSPSLKQS